MQIATESSCQPGACEQVIRRGEYLGSRPDVADIANVMLESGEAPTERLKMARDSLANSFTRPDGTVIDKEALRRKYRHERDKRLRLAGEFGHDLDDPYTPWTEREERGRRARPGQRPARPSRPPPTYALAAREGRTADYRWGPQCDRTTGRLKIPTIYAPPCVPVFSGRGGGSTWNGVSATSINVVYYNPVPIGIPALDNALGTPADRLATARAYVAMLNRIGGLYGRHVNLIPYNATGTSTNSVAAAEPTR